MIKERNLRKIILNKKAVNLLTKNIIFLVLNVLFFSVMFFFVARAGTGTSYMEKAYAKQIALSIDSMRPNTEIEINIEELYSFAEKNRLDETNIFTPNFENNSITIRLAKGDGFTYHCFKEILPGSISIDPLNKKLIIKT